ncbi:hypothetical protein NC653_022026 [Populus alba x Populus x berolinensis]|uniref:Uncharacterized protein n=1 Tax=Populus alba x Populus x berolinensis TaxID=444605 RepID=A0AAD6QFA8_9ROSI|nr:hypothetical protein NC653_022026 [Populus alba x Populus x berolinensis]
MQNQQQLKVDLPENSVLALATPLSSSSPSSSLLPSDPHPPPTTVAKDCSNDNDYDEDEVDYSTSGGSSKFFHSPVPPSTRNNLNATLNNVLKVSPLCFSGQSIVPVATSTKKGPSPRPALQQNIPDVTRVDHNLTTIVSSPAEDSHSGTSHSPAPVEKW